MGVEAGFMTGKAEPNEAEDCISIDNSPISLSNLYVKGIFLRWVGSEKTRLEMNDLLEHFLIFKV